LNRIADMEVVRFPIAFKGLGRSLLLHDDASGPYTLTIPDFDLVTKATMTIVFFGGLRKTKGSTHPTAR
jgi:hypothetical protein